MDSKQKLPIDEYKEEILHLIKTSEVIIISSSTGSGKSTRIPQFILEDDLDVRIMVSQPRRIATQQIADRVAREMEQTVGGIIGYKISMECKCSKDTRITFMTTGVLGAILSGRGAEVKELTHIIIDEVHGRDIHTDLVLLQIKLLQQKMENFNPKILLLSATMNSKKFESYFSHKSVKVMIIPDSVKTFRLEKFFIDDLEKGILTNNQHQTVMVNGLENVRPCFDSNESNPNYTKIPILLKQLYKLEMNVKGGVLIFLPGIGDITDVGEYIKKYARQNQLDWVILELHSNTTDEERLQLFPPAELNQRKIVLATNIAESSITIPDIVYVIDLCHTKMMSHNTSSGFASLVTVLASRHQAEQRAGRAGRTSPGMCFRFVTQHFFDNVMDVDSASEMQTSGLNLAFLYVKNLRMGHPKKLLLEAISPPNINSILCAVHSLKECGALMDNEHYSQENGDMTIIGLLAVNLACDPKLARLIAFGHLFGLLNEAIVIAMCLASKPLFATSTAVSTGVKAFLDKIEIGGRLHSDSLAFLGAYSIYLETKKRNPEFWASDMKKKFIKSNVIRNIEFTVTRVIQKMNRYMNINTNGDLKPIEEFVRDQQQASEFKLLMAAASWPNIFVHRSLTNYENHVVTVMNEIQGFKPQDTLVLQPMDRRILTYEPYQLADLKIQLTNQQCQILPNVVSNGNLILVNYDVNDYQRIGAMADPVLEGMKVKAQNHFYQLNHKEANKPPIKLLGPRSPIAINFHSAFEYCSGDRITRDRDSVNFLAFDEQFPKQTTYTMCSMIVVDGKFNLVAKESTIMEPREGTYEIIHLLFSPKVQLTTNHGKVAGFLVGQGQIPFNAEFSPPQHDQIITSEIELDASAIENINRIRNKINILMELRIFKKTDTSSKEARKLLVTEITRLLSGPNQRVHKNRITSLIWDNDYETGRMLTPIKFPYTDML